MKFLILTPHGEFDYVTDIQGCYLDHRTTVTKRPRSFDTYAEAESWLATLPAGHSIMRAEVMVKSVFAVMEPYFGNIDVRV